MTSDDGKRYEREIAERIRNGLTLAEQRRRRTRTFMLLLASILLAAVIVWAVTR